MNYAERHDPAKPWGHWLHPVTRDNRFHHLEDRQGRVWTSVRHAFFVARLNVCACEERLIHESLDRMAVVLRQITVPQTERAPLATIFDGNGLWFAHSLYWLSSLHLIDHGATPFELITLTDEGTAVLTMLKETMPDPETGKRQQWIPDPDRHLVPRFERRRHQKRLPAPSAQDEQ
ncbi:hypothetical protein [Sphingomonas solaris]|uniref:Uncharacterized protein n=1 Tax=Alterirhizorhabdus solaris TaxID=2529389 RepID=A0A558R5T5_9SPHN|nr:hypothetical protein [Sphingomonas solaris]TVV74746.1 hypothetical protein FOY91_08830 [Sphingomonas solaris]